MNLRFSARGDSPDAIVHLTVVEALHFGEIVRRRGEALCRPKTSLPNLEPLSRQILVSRRCCAACIDTMARIRITRHIGLPPASGVLARDLIRMLAQERESNKVRQKRTAWSFPDN